MDIFQKEYRTYRLVLSLIGLWPYQRSIYTTILRISLFTVTFVCLSIEIGSIMTSNVTVENCFLTLSTSCPLMLFLARYVSFIYNFPVIRFFFDHIRNEENTLEDSNEIEMLMKCVNRSCRVISICLCISGTGIIGFTTILLTPIVLDLLVPLNETRARYIHYITELFTDKTEYIDMISVNSAVVVTFGLLAVSCTESTLSVISYYICGLFKIASYRIRNAILNATNSKVSDLSKQIKTNCRDIRLAVDIHMKAIECIDTVVAAMMIPYLIASLLVVISFAVNIHRALETMNDVKEFFLCIILVTTHVMFMFFNNYSGQMVIDDSLAVFNETCNSDWYYIPVNTQKLLLFILMRSSIQCSLTLSGLFTPCYQGFSAMMSTSFSYFTMMYSVQQS